MSCADTVLIYEEEECGEVLQRFCSEVEASDYLDKAQSEMRFATMITIDAGFDGDFLFRVSPNLRNRVDEAKARIRTQIRLRDALDRHGVPRDRDLRMAVINAFEDFNKGQ